MTQISVKSCQFELFGRRRHESAINCADAEFSERRRLCQHTQCETINPIRDKNSIGIIRKIRSDESNISLELMKTFTNQYIVFLRPKWNPKYRIQRY